MRPEPELHGWVLLGGPAERSRACGEGDASCRTQSPVGAEPGAGLLAQSHSTDY